MSAQGTYLEKIVAAKRAALDRRLAANVPRAQLEARLAALPPCRDFEGALRTGPAPRAIAEFKRASPSEGVIREGAEPTIIARAYEEAGAAAISCLTDPHFKGSFDDLTAVRSAVDLPILCKDFILRADQLVEARLAGADAALLIVTVLEPPSLRQLIKAADELGMGVLCEAHTSHEVERALAAGARVVGVNNRDLHTFEVDIERAASLRASVPSSFTFVAESGIRSRDDVQRLREAGVDGVLVGTHLMKAEDPGLALSDLMAMP